MPTYEIPLLVKVAEMHYYKLMSQKEIGKLLNLSPAKVSRILREAFSCGIIKVEITNNAFELNDLNENIRKKYNLEMVKIVNTPEGTAGWMLKKTLGQEAKKVLVSVLEPDNIVGIGVGGTLYEMIASFNVRELPFSIRIIPMVGGWSSSKLNFETNNLVHNLAYTLGCEYNTLLVPAVLSNEDIRRKMLSEPEIKVISDLWQDLDIAVFSIGPKITLGEHKELYRSIDLENTTGDLLGWPINTDGDLVDFELNNRLMAFPLEQLKKVPKRIAIGGGINKCMNVNAVLKGGYATHLITDYDTALYLLENGG